MNKVYIWKKCVHHRSCNFLGQGEAEAGAGLREPASIGGRRRCARSEGPRTLLGCQQSVGQNPASLRGAGARAWPAGVVRTTGKPEWRVSRRMPRSASTRMRSPSVTGGAAIAKRTGTRSSGRRALGSGGSQGTHLTCAGGARRGHSGCPMQRSA